MKRIAYIAAAALSLLAAASCTQFETVEGDPLNTQIYTLDNGLQVFMTVNKEEPRIQTYIAVKAGGKNGPDESTGLAHYFEHLMFKGTQLFGTSDYAAEEPLLDEIEQLFETYRATTDEAERAAIYHRIDSVSYEASKIAIPNEYDKLMSVIGASGTNAWTSMDETVYQENIPSNQIDNWARIQADRFKNVVLRGFHTELETIYEEKNMSLTQDSRKIWEGLDAALYPNHPYGQRTVLGTQEHLKNPSITNVKKFHDDYYVPNNVRICLSGDFNPKEMVKIIEKYFSDWQPNPDVPVLETKEEQPITSPVVKEIWGREAEMMALGWRIPAARDVKNAATATIASYILQNGYAGLIDLDVTQQQKVLTAQAGQSINADNGEFIMLGRPKAGQSLDEVKDILLAEVIKLRNGEFEESLIDATVNNLKLSFMEQLESNAARAQYYITAFINGIDWSVAAKELERYEAVTKEDVVAWANEFIKDNNYAVIYKRKGEPRDEQKISAPKITPIESNRNMQSDFLSEIQNSSVKPIEPVWVDFSKEMSQFSLSKGTNVLYKHNDNNDIFSLTIVFNTGSEDNPALSLAPDYLSYLGTATMSAEQIATRMYELACSFRLSAGANRTTLSLSGLGENMGEALSIAEDLIFNAQADEDILAGIKADVLKRRENNKTNQSANFSALQRYMAYGPEYIKKTTLGNGALMALDSDTLLSEIKKVYGLGHEISYYGPMSESEVKDLLAAGHKFNADAEALPEVHPAMAKTEGNKVFLAQYDAKQLYYYQLSNRGETFSPEDWAENNMYNEYFGGGMNAIVFQEMREARGLAYSASASLVKPTYADANYYFGARIATQNDKLQIATEAFDEIINDMPVSESAFNIAKDALISRMRTARTIGAGVLTSYQNCRRLGISEPLDKQVFEEIQNFTLEDVEAFQQKWVKDREYTYGILGDIKDLDMDYIKTLGPVQILSSEDIFGY